MTTDDPASQDTDIEEQVLRLVATTLLSKLTDESRTLSGPGAPGPAGSIADQIQVFATYGQLVRTVGDSLEYLAYGLGTTNNNIRTLAFDLRRHGFTLLVAGHGHDPATSAGSDRDRAPLDVQADAADKVRALLDQSKDPFTYERSQAPPGL